MALAPDEHPRDILGRVARPLRYPNMIRTKVSQDASDTLEEMAQVRDTKVATIIRRAVMKEIYIYKAEKAKKEHKA